MSHVTKVQTAFNDPKILEEACKQLNVPMSAVKGFKFVGSVDSLNGSYTGYRLDLKGWRHPVIIQADGSAVYDNYNGAWGSEERMDELKMQYAEEGIKKVAKKKGMKVTRQKTEDGKVQLVVA